MQEATSKLFDIAACQCINITACSCDKDKKVPLLQRNSLIDHRTLRVMMIGCIDAKETTNLKQKYKRKLYETHRNLKLQRVDFETAHQSCSDDLNTSNNYACRMRRRARRNK